MTTATLTLTEFLLARIAEDEAVARQTIATPDHQRQAQLEVARVLSYRTGMSLDAGLSLAAEALLDVRSASWGPARVLAECEAQRRIVEDCVGYVHDESEAVTDGLCVRTLLLLALPYADHPDFRPEWRV